MNDEACARNIPFGVFEIDSNKIFARVGHAVSMRLITDAQTGQARWLSCAEKKDCTSIVGTDFVRLVKKMMVAVTRRSVVLKRSAVLTAVFSLLGGSFSHPVRSHSVPASPAVPLPRPQNQPAEAPSEMDMEIRRAMEKGINLEERRRQVEAIAAAFAKRTDLQRARRLAALCYLKTLGTPFKPIDIAVIALAETGSFGLSGRAVSPKGALGVWQVMPERAESHGYTPEEMKNDEKCAEAAVREMTAKLKMAKGDMAKARKLYCGWGPEADAYVARTRELKREILREMSRVVEARNKTLM